MRVVNRLARLVAGFVSVGLLVGCASGMPPSATARESAPPGYADSGSAVIHLATSAECNAKPRPELTQYIIGYGSLMQDESRKRTSPNAGPAQPVEVAGFRRGWFARSNTAGLGTTFLGAVAQANGRLNAVMYQVAPAELAATDRREASYCRTSVPLSEIRVLDPSAPALSSGQAWIYTNIPDKVAKPDAGFPIAQSYVDIFLSGCLEQEERFGLAGFAWLCLATTADWSPHWINDRLYPRRPFIHQPKASRIDALLARELPALFSKIRVE